MEHEPKLWRKKREGQPYGSWYASIGGRIVNLATMDASQAAALARRKLEELGGKPAQQRAAGGGEPPVAPPVQRRAPPPSPLSAWAGGGAPGPTPAAAGAPTPAAPAELTPAMGALAEGMASAVALLNAAAVAAAVRYLGGVQPAKVDPDEVERLTKTWATGLRELMVLHGLQWWHILLAQNAALGMNLWQNGTALKIEATPGAPRESAPVPAR